MKLKICGMKHNLREVAGLQPDYLGFIFWDKSPRKWEGIIPELPPGILKMGVFVDADIAVISEKIEENDLDAVQLHGGESVSFCKRLKSDHPGLKIVKVFSVKEQFDFSQLTAYETVCDYFLFDTKGPLPGGNGYGFDWKVLEGYTSEKPFFLSGGIGPEDIDKIRSFMKSRGAKQCMALDINSRFELSPGHKNIDSLQEFKKKLGL